MPDKSKKPGASLSEAEVVEAVKVAVQCAKGLRSLARDWGVTPSYLSDIVNDRRVPGPNILKHFGLKRNVVVYYTRTEASKDWPGVKDG